MSQSRSTKCYIEEYESKQGILSVRLREKASGRKVDLGMTMDGRQDFLRFLSEVGNSDFIVVSGEVDLDSPDEIRFIYNENLSYHFA